jgi:hypothetical protein
VTCVFAVKKVCVLCSRETCRVRSAPYILPSLTLVAALTVAFVLR